MDGCSEGSWSPESVGEVFSKSVGHNTCACYFSKMGARADLQFL